MSGQVLRLLRTEPGAPVPNEPPPFVRTISVGFAAIPDELVSMESGHHVLVQAPQNFRTVPPSFLPQEFQPLRKSYDETFKLFDDAWITGRISDHPKWDTIKAFFSEIQVELMTRFYQPNTMQFKNEALAAAKSMIAPYEKIINQILIEKEKAMQLQDPDAYFLECARNRMNIEVMGKILHSS